MKKFVKNGMAALAGVALISAAGLAQAETRFAVQDATGTTDKMVVTDTGYIGVGTNAPKVAMQAKGDSSPKVQIMSHYVGTELLNGGGFLAYKNHPDGSLPKKGERVGYMLFGAYGTDGVNTKNAAGLVGYADADWTNTSIPAYFLFEVAAPGTINRSERMRITSLGNIGMGTPNPTQKLEVNGGVRLNTASVKPTCAAAVRGTLWLTQNNTVGTADTLEVCVKGTNEAYSWTKLY